MSLLKSKHIYSERFNKMEQEQKNKIWSVLCKDFFQHYIRPTDSVVDIGAGYCEFINNIDCKQKYAVEVNEDTNLYAARGVKVLNHSSWDLGELNDGSIHVVFVSNFFEHLRNKEEVVLTLREIYRVLRPDGKLLILGPNIRYLPGNYWDFFDHFIPLSHVSMCEALTLCGFKVVAMKARFLPYTTKSAIPKVPLAVKLYLKLPLLHLLFGKQFFIVAKKDPTLPGYRS